MTGPLPVISVVSERALGVMDVVRALELPSPAYVISTSRRSTDSDGVTRHEGADFTYIGLAADVTLTVESETLTFCCDKQRSVVALAGDPLVPVEAAVRACSSQSNHPELPFVGGFVGMLSYDAMRHYERIVGLTAAEDEPESHFVFSSQLVVVDHRHDKTWLVTWPRLRGKSPDTLHFEEFDRTAHDTACAALSACKAEESSPLYSTEEPVDSELSRRLDSKPFIEMIERAQEYICAGDIFQVVLGNRFELPYAVAPLAVFERLSHNNPSPYHFYLPCRPGTTLVGASPEVFLRSRVTGDGRTEVCMRPVAGTYPVGDGDAAIIAGLQRDSKEQAEHIMLVDHARNDIGRVARIGSVTPADVLSVETYSAVHHLVSEVCGELKERATVFDAFRSCFPIATLTGTPKIRAMEIIAELEGPSRGSHGGSVALFGLDGSVDSTVIIRTAVCGDTTTVVRAGAGIVYDSDPEREYRECHWKAHAVLRACVASRGDAS